MKGIDFIQRARALVPAVQSRARQAEQLRRLPEETFHEFQEAGLFRALQPARYGGLELDPASFYDAVIEIGTVCASSAWVLSVLGVHQFHVGLFPPKAQEEVWGDDSSALVSSAYPPTGKAERVRGGFRLSGRWSFSSGCDYARWAFLGAVVPSSPGTASAPDMTAFLVPRCDYRLEDVWHVAGLAGTGSNDIVIDEAFVPDHRATSWVDSLRQRLPGQADNPCPVLRLPLGPLFGYAIAAPAIGAAVGALQTYQEYSRTRRARLTGAIVAEDPDAQVRYAEAAATMDAVRLQLHENFDELSKYAETMTLVPNNRLARYMFDIARAIDQSWRSGGRVMAASGGTAIMLDNPIQRAMRDLMAIRLHPAANLGSTSRDYGRSAFTSEDTENLSWRRLS